MVDDGEPRIFQPGERFRQYPYVVERFLGSGFSGQVYAVRHLFTDDLFALKVIHLADLACIDRVHRALSTAQASYRIEHANVVHLFDLGCEADGLVWQIMELLDGQTVAALLARLGRLSPIDAIDVAIEAAWGLRAAHEQGVIHRDVQPSNVFVTRDGRIKIIDFSLAKVVATPLTTTVGRTPRGTLGYMAPEHLEDGEPTEFFDVYALAIVFWEMLAGRHPFAESLGALGAIARRHLHDEIPSLTEAAGLPAYFDDLVRGGAAKDPRARIPGMWAFAQALQALRERVLADPEMEEIAGDAAGRPLVRAGGAGGARAEGFRAVVRGGTSPRVPSARVYVPAPGGPVAAPGVAPKRPVPAPTPANEAIVAAGAVPATVSMAAVPATVSMAAVPVPPEAGNRTPGAVAVPSEVRRAGARWIGVAAAVVPFLLGGGAVAWWLGVRSWAPAASPGGSAWPPPPSTVAPRQPASSSTPAPLTSAGARRLPRARPKR